METQNAARIKERETQRFIIYYDEEKQTHSIYLKEEKKNLDIGKPIYEVSYNEYVIALSTHKPGTHRYYSGSKHWRVYSLRERTLLKKPRTDQEWKGRFVNVLPGKIELYDKNGVWEYDCKSNLFKKL